MVSKMIRRTLRLNKELDSKVTEKAKELGISINDCIRMILSKELCKEN